MGVLDYMKEKYYMTVAGTSVLAAGATALVLSPAMGAMGMLVGAGVAAAGVVGGTLFRPIERLEDNRAMTLEAILAEADKAEAIDFGGTRTKSRMQRDRAKVSAFLTLAESRRGILQEEFLTKVAEISSDLIKIIQNPNAFDGNALLDSQFELLLTRNLTDTLNIFCKTPNATSDPQIRAEFANQLDDIHKAIKVIQSDIDEAAVRELQVQGAYLNERYGSKAIEAKADGQ